MRQNYLSSVRMLPLQHFLQRSTDLNTQLSEPYPYTVMLEFHTIKMELAN